MEKINIEDLNGKTYEECVEAGVKIEYSVPIILEKSMIETIVDLLLEEDDDGVLTYDPVEKEIKTLGAIAALYTNIELSDDDYKNYDILNGCGLADHLTYFNDGKCIEFKDKLESVLAHKMEVNDVNHIIARSANQMIDIFDKMGKHVNGMLDKGDPNKVAKYLSKGVEMIASKMPDFSKVDVMKTLEEQVNKKKLS